MATRTADRVFIAIVLMLVIGGFFIFTSASMGLHARDGIRFIDVALKQVGFGVVLGGIAAFGLSRLRYRVLRRYSLVIFVLALLATLLVFVPDIGISHGGAKRWLSVAGFSFQPSEALKLATVIYFAAWLSGVRERVREFRYGLLPMLILFTIVGTVLLAQPDTDTFAVLLAAGAGMFIAAGGRIRDFLITGLIAATAFGILVVARPYLMDRILSFVDPGRDPTRSGYQLDQALLAIGSGGVTGRGFGQSVQKFTYLPEPMGDSIFAVAAEEFGFIGASVLVVLFLLFGLRSLHIASSAPDSFGGLLVVGIAILIVGQAFTNIAAMLGLIPLSGITLPFVSQGGSALLLTLASVGIIANVSKYSR